MAKGTATQTASSGMVEVGKLRPSPLNPRKTFDPEKFAELVVSVKARGVLVPLLVRPVNGNLEIIAGERRWRAAKAAKVAQVPAVIEDMSDQLALEAMVIENAQREDILPLEEAAGYAKLVEFGESADQIAGKVGRPARYVHQRLSLCNLIPSAQKALEAEKILLGHALLIARLPQGQQEWALEHTLPGQYRDSPTVDHLREILKSRQVNVDGAAFKGSDAQLVPKAGACSACPKRSGASPELFAEEKKANLCLDPECFEKKIDSHIAAKLAEAVVKAKPLLLVAEANWNDRGQVLGRNNYKVPDAKGPRKTCTFTTAAIIVDDSRERGRVISVCPNRLCETHWSAWERNGRQQSVAADRAKTNAQKKRVEQVGLRLRQVARAKATRSITARTSPVLLYLAHAAQRRGSADAARLFVKRGGLIRQGEKIGQIDYRKRVDEHIDSLLELPDAPKHLIEFLVDYAIVEDELSLAFSYSAKDQLSTFRAAADHLGIKLDDLVKDADAQLKLEAATMGGGKKKAAAQKGAEKKGGAKKAASTKKAAGRKKAGTGQAERKRK